MSAVSNPPSALSEKFRALGAVGGRATTAAKADAAAANGSGGGRPKVMLVRGESRRACAEPRGPQDSRLVWEWVFREARRRRAKCGRLTLTPEGVGIGFGAQSAANATAKRFAIPGLAVWVERMLPSYFRLSPTPDARGVRRGSVWLRYIMLDDSAEEWRVALKVRAGLVAFTMTPKKDSAK